MTTVPPRPPQPDRGWPTAPPTRDAQPAWLPPGAPTPPTPPPDGPAGGSGGNDTRRTLVLAVAIVAVLALLGGVVAFVTGDGDSDESAADSPSATDRAPRPQAPVTPPPSAADPTPPQATDPSDLDALVADMQSYIEEARELLFLRPVEVELVDDNTFVDLLLEDFEESADELADVEVLFRALALLDDDQVLALELRSLLGANVLGFYDTETDQLVVRGTSLTPYVQQTVLHELVHALDDQHFELFRPEYDERKDEIASGLALVVEGNATLIESDWLAEQTEEFQDAVAAEEATFAARADLDRFPEMLLFQLGAPYVFGELFVDAVVDDRGQRGVDAAFVTPPDTTEQVLFPDTYFAAEPRAAVPVPGVPGGVDVVDDGVLGALFWFGLFTTSGSVGILDAREAVDGWGGDWAVTYQAEGQDCVIADIVGDTPEDTDEFRTALESWAVGNPAASVSVVDDRVRLASCGASSGSGNSNL